MSRLKTWKPIEILLVEDNPGDVRLMREAFKQGTMRLELHVVNDGIDALAFLRREGMYRDAPGVDLVLLDLNLPKMDGRETLTEMKADPALSGIPVMVLTTSGSISSSEEIKEDLIKNFGLHEGCYLTKPLDIDQFKRIVRTVEEFWLDFEYSGRA